MRSQKEAVLKHRKKQKIVDLESQGCSQAGDATGSMNQKHIPQDTLLKCAALHPRGTKISCWRSLHAHCSSPTAHLTKIPLQPCHFTPAVPADQGPPPTSPTLTDTQREQMNSEDTLQLHHRALLHEWLGTSEDDIPRYPEPNSP